MKKCLLTLSMWIVGTSAFGQCLPSFTNPCTSDDFIDSVIFNSISNLGTGCPNPGVNNYSDYTAISTNLVQGSGYPISVSPGPSWGQYFVAWIDFDQNNVFDPSEFFDIGYAAGGGNAVATINIPAGIPSGPTTMRILCRFGTLAIPSNFACSSFLNSGECEDYTVVIDPPAPNDALVASIDGPLTDCGLSLETIQATISNNGINTINDADICYSVNGGPWICDALSGLSLTSLASYQHNFSTPADLSIPGDYSIDVAISLVGDGVSINDTLFGHYVLSKPLINSFPYIEDFENGPGGWQAQNASTGTWELDTPAGIGIIGAASGQNAWITNATGNYASFDNSWVESPCFDFTNLPSGSSIAMNVWWNCESPWDGANLQYSLDDGTTWNTLGSNGDPYNWYNESSVAASPGGSTQGWSGWDPAQDGSSGWVNASHSLNDATFIGQTSVLFRVNFASDGSSEFDGFSFDDVRIAVPPMADLGPDYVGCTEYEINLGQSGSYQWYGEDISSGATYPYSDSSVVVFINPSLTSNSTYNGILILTDSLGMTATDTITMTFTIPPDNTFMDANNCPGNALIYTVGTNPNYTYDWNNGSTVEFAQYTGEGPVYVIVTDTVSGCADTASAMIYQMPAVDIDLNDTMVCVGEIVTLNVADIYDSYLWSNSDSTYATTVTASGMYTIDAIDSNGCLTMDSALVVVNPLPLPSISGLPDTMCVYSDAVITGEAGYIDYSWSTGSVAQTETLSGSLLGLGTHIITLTVLDTNGCIGSADYTLLVDGCADLDELEILFSIYPNPSSGEFNYSIDGELNDTKMSLMDVLGKVLWTEKLVTQNGVIDLSSFESGTYLLAVFQGDSAKVIRLIKQ